MQIEKRQGSEVKGIGTFNNNRFYGDVTEYSFTTNKKLDAETIENILKENGINLYGFVSFGCIEIDFDIDKMVKVFKCFGRESMAM